MALYQEFEPQPNRLIDAESSYLQSAAYQPVGWYEFTQEAFDEARRQRKPIFLDIGAAWCHWCHVIDEESYEDPEIATYLNELYIPIKVDRDERPDIDARYQTAVKLLTGQVGWPLTVFLTPDGEPFYGGTYFPPENRYGRVGFKTLLPKLAETFKNRRPEMEEAARTLSERTKKAISLETGAASITDRIYQEIVSGLTSRFNQKQGGFELNAPKFPHPQAIELALLQWQNTFDTHWRDIVVTTLTRMGQGGIYDQLGGGFHRYSTDDNWITPHFEKMGYDNALLLENYIHAYRAFGNELFLKVAGGTIDFLLRDLTDHKRGGFFAAQDADNSKHDDGNYWTWSFKEFTEPLLQEEVPIMITCYGITQEGNMPGKGKNVLHIAETPENIAKRWNIPLDEVEKRIESGTRKLQEIRSRRKPPSIVKNKFSGWNGLLISSFIEAGSLLNRKDARDVALQAADVLIHDAYDPDQGIYHHFHGVNGASIPGLFEDQVYAARALLDSFSISGRSIYLDTARRLIDLCIDHYWDDEGGGFKDTAVAFGKMDAVELLHHPRKTIDDMPAPSPNAIVAIILDRLWLLTRDVRYRDYARKTLEAFAAYAPGLGPFAASFALAAFYHMHPLISAVIVGDLEDEKTQELWKTALATYRPGRFVSAYSADAENLPFPASKNGKAIAYTCSGEVCAEPTHDPDILQETLLSFDVYKG